VCPVGAVSKTTTEKFIERTSLETKDTTNYFWPGDLEMNLEWVLVSLHDFGVAHGLVNSRKCIEEFLHYILRHSRLTLNSIKKFIRELIVTNIWIYFLNKTKQLLITTHTHLLFR
jgi:hypothetical protein